MAKRAFPIALALIVLVFLVTPALAQGNGATVTSLPVNAVMENPCTGEIITLEGTMRAVYHAWRDGNDGIHAMFHESYQGVVGYGSFGNEYHVVNSELTSSKYYWFPITYPSESTTMDQVRLISKGGDENAILQYVRHVTVNANGDVSVSFELDRVICP